MILLLRRSTAKDSTKNRSVSHDVTKSTHLPEPTSTTYMHSNLLLTLVHHAPRAACDAAAMIG